MAIDWVSYHTEYEDADKQVYLSNTGLKVFKVVEVMNTVESVVNSYNFANKGYIKTFGKKKGKSESYKYKHMKLEIKYWEGKDFEDIFAWTRMSEKVWWRLLQLSRKLKRLGYPQNEYVMYWKLSPTIVWLAFISLGRFTQLEPLIRTMKTVKRTDKIYKHFKRAIPWFGHKSVNRPVLFESFYNPEYKDFHTNPLEREILNNRR